MKTTIQNAHPLALDLACSISEALAAIEARPEVARVIGLRLAADRVLVDCRSQTTDPYPAPALSDRLGRDDVEPDSDYVLAVARPSVSYSPISARVSGTG